MKLVYNKDEIFQIILWEKEKDLVGLREIEIERERERERERELSVCVRVCVDKQER